MSADTTIIPFQENELVLPGGIAVHRERNITANKFGRPTAELIDNRTFVNISEALNWSMEHPEYSYGFEIPLPQLALTAELQGKQWPPGSEILTVSLPIGEGQTREGRSLRSVEGHHGVSTDYETFFNLIINLEPNQMVLFDRGVVWVALDITKSGLPVTLKFNVNAGVHTQEELKEGILQMLSRVNQVTNDLLSATIQ